jgi:hypothetical protein
MKLPNVLLNLLIFIVLLQGCISSMPPSITSVLVAENPSASTATADSSKRTIRRLQVQITCRHGDRSPITSLKDEAYWANELIPAEKLEEMANYVTLKSDEDPKCTHKANGRGPFGKLTSLGLQQMVDLGTKLKKELCAVDSTTDVAKLHSDGTTVVYPFIWTANDKPLSPSRIRVISTSFDRAIQSAQGVIMGIFPSPPTEAIQIDARHANNQLLLPDPQPRNTQEQADLEDQLAARPHLQTKEEDMLPLAVRVTKALHPLLAADAHEAVFGAKQIRHVSAESIEIEPLAWNQLGEITKCLGVRNMLEGVGVSPQDFQDVVQHAAWRWFETFRHARLAYLSMNDMCLQMLETCRNYETEPPMTLFSAHDSTLIGLLCAFKLKQPVAWPEYGSFLMMELLEVEEFEGGSSTSKDLYVRFSLNGEKLPLMWLDGEPTDMIQLDQLFDKVKNEGKATEGMAAE